jgi:hypothetical protein
MEDCRRVAGKELHEEENSKKRIVGSNFGLKLQVLSY